MEMIMKNWKELKEDIQFEIEWQYNKWIHTPYYNIKQFLRNLKLWLPFIWKYRNWSWIGFGGQAMIISLRDTANAIDGYFVGSKKEARRMRMCAKLLERIIEENYCEKERKEHERKWGEIKEIRTPVEDKDYFLVEMYRDNAKTEKEKAKEEKEMKRIWDKERVMEQQDVDLLFETLRKHSRKWWW